MMMMMMKMQDYGLFSILATIHHLTMKRKLINEMILGGCYSARYVGESLGTYNLYNL